MACGSLVVLLLALCARANTLGIQKTGQKDYNIAIKIKTEIKI
jgi:hypothetical protein